MPFLYRKARSGDSLGTITIHCPEEVLRGSPVNDGFQVETHRGSSIKALLRKGWLLSGEISKPAPAKRDAPKVMLVPADKPKAKAKAPELSLLDKPVKAIERAIRTGKHDGQLEALLAAEEGGKTRSGVVSVLTKRMALR